MTDLDPPGLNIVRAADAAAHAQEFSHPLNPRSAMTGTQLARSVGLRRTGVNLMRVPAGHESFAYHAHRHEEEWIYILSGRAVARIDGVEYAVDAGDFIGFPAPSVPHGLANPGPGDLVYLVGGENLAQEIVDFPDARKRLVRSGQQLEMQELDGA